MGFRKAEAMRIHPNIGLFDPVMGRYFAGKHGEAFLLGGLTNFEGVCGLPNTYKTGITLFKKLTVLIRYASSAFHVYDTENHFSVPRVHSMLSHMRGGDTVDLDERFLFTDATEYFGDEWFEDYKKLCEERRKGKDHNRTTEFYNHETKQHLTAKDIYMVFLDSLSEFHPKVIDDLQDKHDVGSKDLNMVDMRSGRIKSHLISHVVSINNKSGMYATMTSHVGEKFKLDPYAADIQKLKVLGSSLKLKKVPESFNFLTNSMWFSANNRPLINQGDKYPEFPKGHGDTQRDTDLQLVTVLETRGKFCPSGDPIELIISQSEGLKRDLTHYYFVRTQRGMFGVAGSPSATYLELAPEIKFTRKSVRAMFDENPSLSRAMDFTVDLALMTYDRPDLDHTMIPSAKDLYEKIKSLGYDWELLYNTRSWWTFLEDKHPLNPLTTMDLVRMYHGYYHPYWYPKSAKDLGITLTENTFGLG